MTENEIAKVIVDPAYKIHTALGPGLLESVYETVMAYELTDRGLTTVRQLVPLQLNVLTNEGAQCRLRLSKVIHIRTII